MMNDGNRTKNLYKLDELDDFKVASEDPDVRGWEVKDADNRTIGKVDNLLVNKERERVVYLDVEVDETIIEADHKPYGKPSDEVHEFINEDGENHLILPVGFVNINRDDEYVFTDQLNHQTFAETKRRKKDAPINRQYEKNVLQSYNRESNMESEENDDTFYERREFDNSKYRRND